MLVSAIQKGPASQSLGGPGPHCTVKTIARQPSLKLHNLDIITCLTTVEVQSTQRNLNKKKQ